MALRVYLFRESELCPAESGATYAISSFPSSSDPFAPGLAILKNHRQLHALLFLPSVLSISSHHRCSSAHSDSLIRPSDEK